MNLVKSEAWNLIYAEEKTVVVTVKSVYGADLVYPVNQNAILLCKLTGQKTLTPKDMLIIKTLGYDIQVKAADLPEGGAK